jgi:membrane protease subunit (stomatin/prohibitin family)
MSVPYILHSEITDTIYIVCGGNKYNVTEQVIKAMRETGRLEQQRPHGKWEWTCPSPTMIKTPHCSNCGHINDFLMETNFCPNCGADMRKEGGD